ncbi:hypothetical protein [Halalkalibacterium ligniniphilum]|nr:hypothetical protein [Halalkalibacterium ligniniphilum]
MGFSLLIMATGLVLGYLNFGYLGALIGLFAAIIIGMLIRPKIVNH